MKKKFKIILVVQGEEFKLRKLLSKEFTFVFFTAESLSCSETQPTQSVKFLKGLRYMVLSITVKEITF